ncbi:hypothetical protein [Streptomyces sp. NBC_01443]|uniref:hypothetical protein n=1 Tax=Streptomyces sp. NBC_01443 TaxID=2903868 RepID=UPI0022515172|nr:hypothetical protein [Streptomyces sp. NBC_01443]MCX4626899.1 hypothetical protein [Streptomyces sp. NBC_01443]WSW43063.1 hypothetical protein OG296_07980 [Streptomyces sp. NBC_01001]
MSNETRRRSADVRRRVEQIALGLLATSGVVVLLADLFGWLDALAPGGALPKVTLLILSTVTVFLLLELDRLKRLDDVQDDVKALDTSVRTKIDTLNDNVEAHLSKLDVDAIAQRLKRQHYGGVVGVHSRFPEEAFTGFLERAGDELVILQTWIPNLHHLRAALRKALVDQQVSVRILLLHPSSPVAGLRDEALRAVRDPALAVNVKASVESCLAGLAQLNGDIPAESRARLKVRLYNSLPSIAVFKVDQHLLVSSFLHGQLAIDSTQIEIDGGDTVMGEEVQQELRTLWSIGKDVDLLDWRTSVANISL